MTVSKRMKHLALFIGVLFLCGCASLTQTQLQTVNAFGETTKDYSAYPSRILYMVSNVRESSEMFSALLEENAEKHVAHLERIIIQKHYDDSIGVQADISFQIIDRYAQALILLTSHKHEETLQKGTAALGGNIDFLLAVYNNKAMKKVPTGIGRSRWVVYYSCPWRAFH